MRTALSFSVRLQMTFEPQLDTASDLFLKLRRPKPEEGSESLIPFPLHLFLVGSSHSSGWVASFV